MKITNRENSQKCLNTFIKFYSHQYSPLYGSTVNPI